MYLALLRIWTAECASLDQLTPAEDAYRYRASPLSAIFELSLWQRGEVDVVARVGTGWRGRTGKAG